MNDIINECNDAINKWCRLLIQFIIFENSMTTNGNLMILNNPDID